MANGKSSKGLKAVEMPGLFASGVTVSNHNWGAIFRGTKAALIKAALASDELFPKKGRESAYQLPLNADDGWHAACFGPAYGEIPPSWTAKLVNEEEGTFSLYVEYNERDLNTRQRAQEVIAALDSPKSLEEIKALIRSIPPNFMSDLLGEQLLLAKNYPKRKAA